jgi:hypothetical protein
VDAPATRIDAVVVLLSKRTLHAAWDEIEVPPVTLRVNADTAPTAEMVALPSTTVVAAVNRT